MFIELLLLKLGFVGMYHMFRIRVFIILLVVYVCDDVVSFVFTEIV